MHDACAARRGVLHDHCVQALPLHMFSLTGFKPSDGSRGVLRFIADLFSLSWLYCPSGPVVVKSKGWVLRFAQPGPVFHNFYDVKKSEIWRRFSTRDAFEVAWSGLRLSDISESVACHIVSCSLSWPRMRRRASETNSDHVTCVCVCVCSAASLSASFTKMNIRRCVKKRSDMTDNYTCRKQLCTGPEPD